MRDEDIKHADRELADFIWKCNRLVTTWYELKEINARIEVFGVSSPKIRSKEEAKYQRGTQIYSDVPLLELFEEEAELTSEYKKLSDDCNYVRKKLQRMLLTDMEIELLTLRYEHRLTFYQISSRLNYSYTSVYEKLTSLLEIYSMIKC